MRLTKDYAILLVFLFKNFILLRFVFFMVTGKMNIKVNFNTEKRYS